MTTFKVDNASKFPIFESVVDSYENVDLNRGSCNDTESRVRATIAEIIKGRTAVFLTLGQSNAANSGEVPYSPVRRVFNFNVFDSQCYVARDPLLGTTERRGNFATRLADLLIDRDVFDSIVLVSIAVGGSRLEEWTTGGSRHRRLQLAIHRAHRFGLHFTHVLWHQGETNARHDPDEELYTQCFMNLHRAIRGYGVGAPIYVAQATLCDGPPVESIRRAQRAVVNPASGIFAGPDTDTITGADRFDGCHMSASGLMKHGRLWADIIEASCRTTGP